MVGSGVDSGSDPEMEDEMFDEGEGRNGNNEWNIVEIVKERKVTHLKLTVKMKLI